MVCLETDFLIDLIRKKEQAISKLEELTSKNENLSITPVSLTEIFVGAFKSKKQENVEIVEKIASTLDLLDYDFFAARQAGETLAFLEEKGQKIGDLDIIIAAIVIRHQEKLLTRNIKHFKQIKALELVKY